MKMLQVGLGEFGLSWLRDVLIPCNEIEISGLVDKNRNNLIAGKELTGVKDTLLFTEFHEALSSVKPDFILNVTPPGIHKSINLEAFEGNIPVLSEKPIAEKYEDVLEIYKKSEENNVPIMISENYRFFEIIRKTREIITSGEIGMINTVAVEFFRNHRMTNYHKDLMYPLLLDVSIHHFDMLRYLTGSEVQEVFAKAWNPSWSWYTGYPATDLLIDMENNIKVSYQGSLVSPVNDTDWLGDWKISGSEGVLKISDHELFICNEQNEKTIRVIENIDSRKKVLQEFMDSLKENRPGETALKENIKTYNIVEAAIRSIERKQVYQIIDLEV